MKFLWNCLEKRRKPGGVYITASSVTDIFYIIRKEIHNSSQTYVIMDNIFRLASVVSVTERDIREAFDQRWKDFEDCVQYTAGKNNKMRCTALIRGNGWVLGGFPDVLILS